MNKQIKDRVGKKYGKLLVISISDKRDNNNKILWKCKCDCGNLIEFNSSTLNQAKSCGKCLNKIKKPNGRASDLTGKIFGLLKIINRIDGIYPPKWKCKCDCGNEINVFTRNLKRKTNPTISCGCLKNNLKKKTLVGETFGSLVVLERVENYISPKGVSQIQYCCLCKCGRKRNFTSSTLKKGLATHCGCELHRSIIEEQVEKFLIENKINYLKEFRIKECCDKRVLPFDFVILNDDSSIKLLLELNGQHHYELRFGYTEERFNTQKRHDDIKRTFCNNNDYILIEIPYWSFSKYKEILTKELL